MGCDYRKWHTVEYWDGKNRKLNKYELKKFLKESLEFWKWAVENEEISKFNLHSETSWRIDNITKLRAIVKNIRIENDDKKIKSLLLKLFSSKKEEVIIWAASAWGLFLKFIKESSKEEVLYLKNLIQKLVESDDFNEGWCKELSNKIMTNNESIKNLKNIEGVTRNVLGEFFGKLHIDMHPIYNGNSKKFLGIFFNYNQSSYHEFEECFEVVKKEYIENIGRLMPPEVPINLEIDTMFNFYFHKGDLNDGEKWKELMKQWYENYSGKNSMFKNEENKALTEKQLPCDNEISISLFIQNQVILYGPPGTGKTWIARNYVKRNADIQKNSKNVKVTSLRTDLSYYILVMNTKRYPIGKIKAGMEEEFSGNIRSAFEALVEGDIAFVYIGAPNKEIYGVAQCTKKIDDHRADFKILQTFHGPTYEEMKSEEPIMSNPGIRSNLRGTLLQLAYEEALWIASKIDMDILENLNLFESMTQKEYTYYDFVTFHPSFSYEDFVEGIKPHTEDKELVFNIEEGVFKKMAREAYNALLDYAGIELSKRWIENRGLPKLIAEEKNKVKELLSSKNFPKFYLVIDEINRGDVSKIFGELITLLEKDKRLFMENEMIVELPYSKKIFGVPPNLYIIGTMNTADRSIALMDVALRRRFAFLEIMPDIKIVENKVLQKLPSNITELAKKAIDALEAINERIRKEYDRDHQIGHSYYLQLGDIDGERLLEKRLTYIWNYEILPLLQEYFYGSEDKLAKILYDCGQKNESFEGNYIECYKEQIKDLSQFFDNILKGSKNE